MGGRVVTATTVRPVTAPAATRILLWADALSFRDLDRLATAWRDDSFPGRSDLRDQMQMLLLEAGLRNPFAELRSELGQALSDLGTAGALLAAGIITAGSPECRLVYPVAEALFDGDLDLVVATLVNGWCAPR